MNHDRVRPWKSDISNWFSLRPSTCHAAKLSIDPSASWRACSSVDGLATAHFRIARSSLNTHVV